MDIQETLLEKLKKGLELVELLKKENSTLAQNYQTISLSFDTLQDKHKELFKEFNTLKSEKESLILDLDSQKERFKARLTEKDKEIQEINKKPPKDVELFRLDLIQEIELKQQEKFEMVDKECLKFRNLYYKVKREWDASRSDFEIKTAEIERKSKEKIREYEIDISNLHSKIATLQANAQDISELERLRVTQREKNELELKVKNLLSEIEEIRAEKQELVLQSEKDQRTFKRQLADHITEAKNFHSEKDSLQSKCVGLEEDLRSTNIRKDQIIEENNRLRKELDRVTSRLEENAHRYKVDLSDLKLSEIKVKKDYENQVEQLKNKIDQVQNELKSTQQVMVEQREKLSQQERDYLDKLRLAREEEWQKLSLVETEKHEIEKQYAALKQRNAEQESKNEQLQKEYFVEIERLKKEIHEYKMTIEQLQTEAKDLISGREHQKMVAEKSRQKQEEIHVLMVEATTKIDNLERKTTQLNETINILELKNQELSKQVEKGNNDLAREIEAYEHSLERQLLKYQQEKQKHCQDIEILQKERLALLEKLELNTSLFENQIQGYESKIHILREKVKVYKTETNETKQQLENFHLKEQERQEHVFIID